MLPLLTKNWFTIIWFANVIQDFTNSKKKITNLCRVCKDIKVHSESTWPKLPPPWLSIHLLSPLLPLIKLDEGQAVNIHPPCRVNLQCQSNLDIGDPCKYYPLFIAFAIPQPHHSRLQGLKNYSVAIEIQLHLLHLHTSQCHSSCKRSVFCLLSSNEEVIHCH